MNAFQAMQTIEQKTVQQIDAATAAVEKIGRGPVDDAITRLESASLAAQERMVGAGKRAGGIIERMLDRMGQASAAATDIWGVDLLSVNDAQTAGLLIDATATKKAKKGG